MKFSLHMSNSISSQACDAIDTFAGDARIVPERKKQGTGKVE